jgi:hypothetical protein
MYSAAQEPERKIVIDHGNYYFCSIDPEFQVGTLHTGKTSDPLKNAKKLALPAGRNYDEPLIPFCWDVRDTSFYAINFLVHPLNDRNEALKRINIQSLKAWSNEITPLSMIMQGTDLMPFTNFEPYAYTIRRSNTLEDFFFDGIALSDTSYCVGIANKGELTFWNWNGKTWKHSNVFKFPVKEYFTLIQYNKKAYLVMNSGSIYEATAKGIVPADIKLPGKLSEGILLANKDKNTILYVKNKDLGPNTTLDEVIEKKSKRIF